MPFDTFMNWAASYTGALAARRALPAITDYAPVSLTGRRSAG